MPSISQYFQNGPAPSTQKTNAAALKQFHTFCTTFNVATPFPVSEQLLCGFLAHLAGQGLAHQTGRTYVSGGSVQYAILPRPARPERRLLPPNPTPCTGRNQEVMSKAPSQDKGAPSYYSPYPGSDQSYTGQLSPPQQSAPMGGGLHCILCCCFSGRVSCYLRAQPQSAQPRHSGREMWLSTTQQPQQWSRST